MKHNRRKIGVVLVGVLWVVIILMMIITVTAQTSRIDTRITMSSGDRIRCKWACKAGLEKAIAILEDDLTDSDSLFDLWSDNPEDMNSIELDMCTFSVTVTDEAGKLNINTASKDQLMYLPDMTEDIADSILDWRDSNEDPRDLGAETPYYINLPYPYQARNSAFKTIRELLMVKGVTPALLYAAGEGIENISQYNEGWINYLTCYSYDTNEDAEGNTRININSASERQMQTSLEITAPQARWIVENRNYDSIADLMNSSTTQTSGSRSNSGSGSNSSRGSTNRGSSSGDSNNDREQQQSQPLDLDTFYRIADKITVTNRARIRGRVNVNTAPLYVLTALLEGEEQIAQDIISYRDGLSDGMISVADLKDVESITVEVAREFIDFVTTRSSVYKIEAVAAGQTTQMEYKIEAVVDRSESPTEILYYRQGAHN